MPKVYSKKYSGVPAGAVYVGRPTKWGNPFTHIPNGKTMAQVEVGTRAEAVACYEDWIQTQPHLMNALHELRGKDLVCWCAPLACHADVLLRLANK